MLLLNSCVYSKVPQALAGITAREHGVKNNTANVYGAKYTVFKKLHPSFVQ